MILLLVWLCFRWHDAGRTSDLRWLAIVLALITTVRADAAVAAVVVAIYAAVRGPAGRRRQAAVVLLGTVVGMLAVQTVLRRAYFGELFPNTYYLKVSGIPLRTRLQRGVLHLISTGIRELYAPLLLAAIWPVVDRTKRRWAELLLLLVGAQLAYSAYVGGDSYDGGDGGSRYVAVVLPCLMIAAALGVESLVSLTTGVRRLVAGGAALSLVVVTLMRAANVQPGEATQLGPTPGDSLLLRVGLPLALLAAVTWALVSARSIRPARAAAVLGVAVALVAAFSVQDLNATLRRPSGAASFDAAMTRYALALRDATSADAVIATGAAGEIGYFSERQIVDVLGYTDDHISHLRPSGAFIPGHNKFDLAYSIGVLRPDVIAGTVPQQSAAIRLEILGFGYEELGNQLFVRLDSTRVDRAALRRFVESSGRTAPRQG
jgi:hypothetical protein